MVALKIFSSFILFIILISSSSSSTLQLPLSNSFTFTIKPNILARLLVGTFAALSFCASSVHAKDSTGLFNTAADIPKEYFKEKRSIEGVVVKITDGDTYRVRNINKNNRDPKFKGLLSENTIVVRIAAVDTPETAKFGNQGQKLGPAATDFAKEKLFGKKVSVKLLSKDQYGRVVGLVKYKEPKAGPFAFLFGGEQELDISEQLLLNGLGVVYRQGGAQYDGGISRWEELENVAVKNKKGIWVNGRAAADLPSDYKKATKAKSADLDGKKQGQKVSQARVPSSSSRKGDSFASL